MLNDQDDISTMDAAEQAFAAQADAIFFAAQQKHLALGHEVLIAQGDALYTLSPDGTRKVVGRIKPAREVTRGARYRLR